MLTPLDIQNKEFRRSLRGYNESEVDEFLDRLAQDYEWIYMENERLKERLEDAEAGYNRYQEMEQTIKDTLVMAQKNSEELRQNTQKEVENMLNEARQKAREIVKEAEDRADQLVTMAEERAQEITKQAEEKARSILDDYQELQKQAEVFRVKFRSFLEAQLELLEQQEKELAEPFQEIASGYEFEDKKVEAGTGKGSQVGEDAGEGEGEFVPAGEPETELRGEEDYINDEEKETT